ncbi:MAG: helix-turn-helix transcriptional regulator [bacterium]
MIDSIQIGKIKTSKEIGELIKKRRKECKISQERLAEVLDISYQQIQRYENGTNKLNVENIQIIAQALGVPTSYFFEHKADGDKIAEAYPIYVASSEEDNLLREFRRIKDRSSKNIVIQVTELAAKD